VDMAYSLAIGEGINDPIAQKFENFHFQGVLHNRVKPTLWIPFGSRVII